METDNWVSLYSMRVCLNYLSAYIGCDQSKTNPSSVGRLRGIWSFQISVSLSIKSDRVPVNLRWICFTCHFPKALQQGYRFSPIHVKTATAWANVCYLWFQLEVRCLSGTGRCAYQDRPAGSSHYHMVTRDMFHKSHVTTGVLFPSVSHCKRCECKLYIHGDYDSMFKANNAAEIMHAIFNQSTVLNESCLDESLETCHKPVKFHPKINYHLFCIIYL